MGPAQGSNSETLFEKSTMSSEEKLTLTPISSIPDGNGKPVVEEGMNEIETFYGLIETTADALKVIELCRQGKLGRVRRRLHDKERKMIRSGSVFVFDETESGVKRWTDGRLWSPSRILGNFLIYRELERKTLDASSWEAESAVPQPENELNDFDLAIFSGSEELEGLLPWLSDPIVNSVQVYQYSFQNFHNLFNCMYRSFVILLELAVKWRS